MEYFRYLLTVALTVQVVFSAYSVFGGDLPDVLTEQIEKINAGNKELVNGYSEETGVYIISVGSAVIGNNVNKKVASEIALVKAKENIAAFLGETISAESQHEVSEKTTNDNTEFSEFYKSVTKIGIDQFLCGITIFDVKEEKGSVKAVCYVTEKVIDQIKKLQSKKDELGPNTVSAVGLAVIINNRKDSAQKSALDAALRSAVEQVLGTDLLASTQVQNDEQLRSRIFAFAAGFIEEYRIISEDISDGNYIVSIVAKVQKEKLRHSYKNVLSSMGDPAFYVTYDNEDVYSTFVGFFADLGFNVTTDINSADYFVDISSKFREIDPSKLKMEGTQLSLWLKISDAVNKRELLTIRNQPGKATVFKLTPERRMEKAAEMAFEQIKPELHEKLNKLIGGMAASGRPVKIVIMGYEESLADAVTQICATVEMVPGAHNVNRKIDPRTNEVVISLNFQGLMDDLEFFLRAGMKENLSEGTQLPVTKGIETNVLTLKF